ncbi:hypothetical protein ACHAWF_018914 [Thalassiosira exigua]
MKYFITDKIQQEEVQVENVPTDKMWIDMHTKSKQCRPFCEDRSQLMGCHVDLHADIGEPM